MSAAEMPAMWATIPLAEAVVQVFQFMGSETRLQAIFDEFRGRCYDKQIRFPNLVALTADALLEHGGSGHQSFRRAQASGDLEASLVAAYGKLGRLPTAVSQAFLAHLSDDLRNLFPIPAYRQSPQSLQDMATVIFDGKAIKRVAKRLKPLRNAAGGMLGGRALVALHYQTGLVIGMHAHEDGDANDVRFVPELLPTVRTRIAGQTLFMADSAFCDLCRFQEFTAEGNHFLVRRHPKVGFHPDPDRPPRAGTDAQGRTFRDEWGWLGAASHAKRRYVRQITLERPGEAAVTIVTDLLDAKRYPAEDLLEHYRKRWGIEQVFQKVTVVFHLRALIGSTPKATIFQFAFCLLLYNLIQVIRGYIAAHQQRPAETISTENLFLDVHRHLTAWSVLMESGMELTIAAASDTQALADRLHAILAFQWTDLWIKAASKKRRSHAAKPHNRTHGSVFRVLQAAPKPETRRC